MSMLRLTFPSHRNLKLKICHDLFNFLVCFHSVQFGSSDWIPLCEFSCTHTHRRHTRRHGGWSLRCGQRFVFFFSFFYPLYLYVFYSQRGRLSVNAVTAQIVAWLDHFPSSSLMSFRHAKTFQVIFVLLFFIFCAIVPLSVVHRKYVHIVLHHVVVNCIDIQQFSPSATPWNDDDNY